MLLSATFTNLNSAYAKRDLRFTDFATSLSFPCKEVRLIRGLTQCFEGFFHLKLPLNLQNWIFLNSHLVLFLQQRVFNNKSNLELTIFL